MDDLRFEVINGDCLDAMAAMDAQSVHAVVCDPPYGLSFMGKDWDRAVPGPEYWAAALRVARPGAHLLAFGGTRLWHRLAAAIEDAGWEVRDTLMWMYGSGFPKSLDVGKAIDAAAGVEREVIGLSPHSANRKQSDGSTPFVGVDGEGQRTITAPATPEAQRWDGWGTALKPAWEPVVLARKPLGGTVAACVTTHGTGGLNIGGCRVVLREGEQIHVPQSNPQNRVGVVGQAIQAAGGVERNHEAQRESVERTNTYGRWPANVILDPDAAAMLDLEAGDDGGGGPSRFFYCGKATREDRDDGLEGEPKKARQNMGSGIGGQPDQDRANNRNAHPTVKPTDLMASLCRLVTPPGGVVLDPFCGSGSTGRGALRGGFHFVGIERDPEHAAVARKRIAAALGPSLFARAVDMGAARN